jgi:hypothetical protein
MSAFHLEAPKYSMLDLIKLRQDEARIHSSGTCTQGHERISMQTNLQHHDFADRSLLAQHSADSILIYSPFARHTAEQLCVLLVIEAAVVWLTKYGRLRHLFKTPSAKQNFRLSHTCRCGWETRKAPGRAAFALVEHTQRCARNLQISRCRSW